MIANVLSHQMEKTKNLTCNRRLPPKEGPLHPEGFPQEARRIVLGLLYWQTKVATLAGTVKRSKQQGKLLTTAMRVMWDWPEGHLAASAGAGHGCLPWRMSKWTRAYCTCSWAPADCQSRSRCKLKCWLLTMKSLVIEQLNNLRMSNTMARFSCEP